MGSENGEKRWLRTSYSGGSGGDGMLDASFEVQESLGPVESCVRPTTTRVSMREANRRRSTGRTRVEVFGLLDLSDGGGFAVVKVWEDGAEAGVLKLRSPLLHLLIHSPPTNHRTKHAKQTEEANAQI